jgi:hypothetical protein
MYFIMINERLAVTEQGPLCFDTDDEAAGYVESVTGVVATDRFLGGFNVQYVEGDEIDAFLARTPTIPLRSVGDGSEQVPL